MTNRIVPKSAWLEARRELLAREKELTRQRDALAVVRRDLPWVRIEKQYTFQSLDGPVTLGDLFGGRKQLFVKHFMMAPGAREQCVGCSLEVDHANGIVEHLEHHGVAYVVVARAPMSEIEPVRQRMGWRVRWVSSFGSDFNYDFDVSYTPEQIAAGKAYYNFHPKRGAPGEAAGDTVFYRDDDGQIYLTYATFGCGGEEFLGIYRYFDLMPLGRQENGPYKSLADWVRLRPLYTQENRGGVPQDGWTPDCECRSTRTDGSAWTEAPDDTAS